MLVGTGCSSLRQQQPVAHAKKREGTPCTMSYRPMFAIGPYGTLKCDYKKGHEGHHQTTWEYTEWKKDQWKPGGKVADAAKLLRLEAH